jgi:hypothetical protein
MGASAAIVGLSGTSAPAKDPRPPRACLTAYNGAQERERSGHLKEGRELLLACAKPTCGALQKKCASGAGQLASDIAQVAPVVTDDAGAAVLDVEVKVDGVLLTSRMDGRSLSVDPGEHQFSFSARVGPWPGRAVSTTRTITIEQGQRGPIAIALPPPEGGESTDAPGALATAADRAADDTEVGSSKAPAPAAPDPEASPVVRHASGPSAFAYLLGGVGLLGLGAGGLLTYWGKTDNDALAACSPNCQPSSVDHIRRLYLAADVSFGAGGALLGVAGLLFATTPHVEVQPVRSGALATFTGAF